MGLHFSIKIDKHDYVAIISRQLMVCKSGLKKKKKRERKKNSSALMPSISSGESPESPTLTETYGEQEG